MYINVYLHRCIYFSIVVVVVVAIAIVVVTVVVVLCREGLS